VTTILEVVATRTDGVQLTGLTEALDAPRSSVYSLIRGLLAVGYITEDKPGRYRLGPAIAALLDQAPQRRMPQILRPVLERLAAETGETALLGTRVGASVVYLDQVESSARIRYAAPLHQRRPLAGTSTGKTFLAEMTAGQVSRLLKSQPASPAVDARALAADLARIREEGVAYNRGETVEGVTAAAAGVRSAGKVLVAAISVAGPTDRMTGKLDMVAASVRTAARQATELLAQERWRREGLA
jgi:DNA-binding IclR family transcriptional regulator